MFYEHLIKFQNFPSQIMNALREAYVIKAQNVADYFFANPEKEWNPGTDFPNIAPPFSNFFIEYRIPGTNGNIYDINEIGIHVLSEQKSYEQPFHYIPDYWQISNDVKWVNTYVLYLRKGNDLVVFSENKPSALCWYMAITENGNIGRDARTGEELWAVGTPDELPLQDARNISSQLQHNLYISLLTISFLHCKNVKLIEKGKGVTPYKRNRHGPKIRYHILEIEPMKKILRTEGESQKTGLKMALHICRGHFKDYREHGLFGKLHDIYWWDSLVRGDIDYGYVDKDYSIKLNKTERTQK